MRKINGTIIKSKMFAYDGCHKLYLINDKKSKQEAIELNYDIYDIKDLVYAFINSCSLRFINEWGGDFKPIIKQFEKEIVFEGFDTDDNLYSYEYDICNQDNKCVLKQFQ